MRILDPGHRYELDNLQADTKTVLQFMKDPILHDGDGADGPSCQEVLRAIIDRVKSLNAERPWFGNDQIVYHARMMIALFEARATMRRVEKDGIAIEHQPVDTDGHLLWAQPSPNPA